MDLHNRLLLEDNILIITIHDPVATEERAALTEAIDLLIDEHRPAALVITLEPAADTPAGVSVVLRTHRHCTENGIPMAAAAAHPANRYLIKSNQPTLPVHTHTDHALLTARTLLRR
ncbi:hypothetical protein ACE1OC_40925 [Streptomyces sp. DSM 116496]|uniref:hypothetical protein n=1 Tax=Streptomyces stoeckheimensis TaxID=3344656 RepID=UPI0038B317CD